MTEPNEEREDRHGGTSERARNKGLKRDENAQELDEPQLPPTAIRARVKAYEPRDWSNYVEPLGIGSRPGPDVDEFESRCAEFLNNYSARLDRWRYPIATEQHWSCFYSDEPDRPSVLRTFAPVVHRGIECESRAADIECDVIEHHCVACMNHASALDGRTDDELRAAMRNDKVLARCYPIPLLPNGHGWCGTGVRRGDRGMFTDTGYRPGGWGERC